jgi:hypothetical protein
VGIAAVLLAAIHQVGLVSLTHTSPMNFLTKTLSRPENETFSLIPVGYPAEDCWVPDIKEKDLKIFVFLLIRAKLTFNKSYDHEKINQEDISQEVFDLYDDYAHNKIDRRRFVEKLSLFAVGALTVPSLLSFMTPNYVDSILIKPVIHD